MKQILLLLLILFFVAGCECFLPGGKAPDGNIIHSIFLKKYKIALWDMVMSCEIEGSADASINNIVTPNIVTN